MPKRAAIFLGAAAGFVVTWLAVSFVLDADLHLKKTHAAPSTAGAPSAAVAPEPSKTAHAANQTTMRILALDRAKHLAFWALILRNRKQACDAVVWTMYLGGTESGVDNWSIRCGDGNSYSVNIDQGAQGSVCTGKAFAPSAE